MRRPRRSLPGLRVREEDVELIATSEYFDPEWYLGQVKGRVVTAKDAPRDYLSRGWRDGLTPSEDFDPDWYLSVNADVADSGVEPLTHFLRFGRAEGREAIPRSKRRQRTLEPMGVYPSSGLPVYLRETSRPREDEATARPLDQTYGEWFDDAWYRTQSNAPFGSTAELAHHYATIGWRLGYSPSRGFDPQAYLRAYPDLRVLGVEPLLHYLLVGRRQGRMATPVADPVSLQRRPLARYPTAYLEGLATLGTGVLVVRWRRVDAEKGLAERSIETLGSSVLTAWRLEGNESWIAGQVSALLSGGSATHLLLAESSVAIAADALQVMAGGLADAKVVAPLVVDADARVVSAGVRIMPDGNLVNIGQGWSLDHDLLGPRFVADSADPVCLLAAVDALGDQADGSVLESLRALVAGSLLASAAKPSVLVIPGAVATLHQAPALDRGHAARTRREREWFRAHLPSSDLVDVRASRPTDDVLPRGYSRSLIEWDVLPDPEGDLIEVVARRVADALADLPATQVAVRCLRLSEPRTSRVATLEAAGIGVWREADKPGADSGRVVSEVLRIGLDYVDGTSVARAEWVDWDADAETALGDAGLDETAIVLLWMPPSAPSAEMPTDEVALIVCEQCLPRQRGPVHSTLAAAELKALTPKLVLWSRRPARTTDLALGLQGVRGSIQGVEFVSVRKAVVWDSECSTCAIGVREASHGGVLVYGTDGTPVTSKEAGRDLAAVLAERPSLATVSTDNEKGKADT